jgi:hypothetical protein
LIYRATESWLKNGMVDGAQRGEFAADASGKVTPSPA